MPKFVSYVEFDSKLFNLKIGRIELNEDDMGSLEKSPSLEDVLQTAYSAGYRLIYVFGPSLPFTQAALESDKSIIPGLHVDSKLMYTTPLSSFNKEKLCTRAFLTPGIRVRPHDRNATPLVSDAMRSLGLQSGVFSRYHDKNLPEGCYEAMFTAWITNSLNRSLADEVLVAYEEGNEAPGNEIGFLTMARRGNAVNFGLMAVSDKFRRRGIALAMLFRGILWCLETIGQLPNAEVNLYTQGTNGPMTALYDAHGFQRSTLQDVYHVWLPENLVKPLFRADRGVGGHIPFCKQHFTGKKHVLIF